MTFDICKMPLRNLQKICEFIKNVILVRSFSFNNMTLPYYTSGEVIKGFGRGSKELGIPTANFPESVVDNLPSSFKTGVYFGWANVDNGPVHKMVMSVGRNPYYKNIKKSMETHIMHDYQSDFYGSNLKVWILGYLRPEKDFKSLDDLITAIKKDISEAEQSLDGEECLSYKNHKFFTD